MKLQTMSNPFTGHEMKVPVFDDGSFIFDCAFTHKTIAVGYDSEHDVYIIPAKAFEHVQTVSLVEAAEMLDVSKMRVSTLCAKGQLRFSKINGVIAIEYESVLDYMHNREEKGYAKDLKANDRNSSKLA